MRDKLKLFRARRNFKGNRGWIYEGTLLMREHEDLLPTIDDKTCSQEPDYFWQEMEMIVAKPEEPK